jgi:predicted MFS family arabinose efflux permease
MILYNQTKNNQDADAARWAFLALALGGFGIGAGEFIIMRVTEYL